MHTLIRALGVLLGVGALGIALFGPGNPPLGERIEFFLAGALFLGYGLGGERLLARFAPHLTKKVD